MGRKAAEPAAAAPWIWPRLDERDRVVTVTPAHLARIRAFAPCWNAIETGAAGLSDGGDMTWEEGESELRRAAEVFMQTARLPVTSARLRNPFAAMDDATVALHLEEAPDRAVAASLAGRADLDFTASAQDIALWSMANRVAIGIDPKRPFHDEAPAQVLRRVIDPDGALTRKEMTEAGQALLSRQMLMLLLFVQQAELEPGTWVADSLEGWRLADPEESAPPMLDRAAWFDELFLQHHDEGQDYIEAMDLLIRLAELRRLGGSYPRLVPVFFLQDAFDGAACSRHEGRQEARLRDGLRHFPETAAETAAETVAADPPLLVLALTRLLNAQGRAAEARAVLEPAGLWEIAPETLAFDGPAAAEIAAFEGVLARHMLGLLDDAALGDILSGQDRAWRRPGRRSALSHAEALLAHADAQRRNRPVLLDMARATAAQLVLVARLLRAGQRPLPE